MSSAPSTSPIITPIPLDLIDESPSNPRKIFSDIGDLAESIRQKGILQPIVVRPVADRYEIVFGHRRFRACREAELPAIPAIVRSMADVEVIQEQLVENAQRQDVHPLEEADAYLKLHKEHGMSGEDIAAAVGKKKGVVFARMKLASLVDPELREAFLHDELPMSTALLVARCPADVQKAAAQSILFGGMDGDEQSTPMTVRQAARYLFEEHFIKLNEDHLYTKGERAGQDGGHEEGALVDFEVMTQAKEKWERKEQEAKDRAKQVEADYKKRADESKKKAKVADKPAAKKAPTKEEIIAVEKSKAAEAIRKAIFAKVTAKPEMDSKLFRIFLAIHTTVWMLRSDVRYGMKPPENFEKLSKKEQVEWKLDAFGKLSADRIRELVLAEAFDYDNDLGDSGIQYRPDGALGVLTPVAKLVGVNLEAIDKEWQASVTKALAKIEKPVQTSALAFKAGHSPEYLNSECPDCGALPGRVCKGVKGGKSGKGHAARLQAATDGKYAKQIDHLNRDRSKDKLQPKRKGPGPKPAKDPFKAATASAHKTLKKVKAQGKAKK